MLWLTVLLAGVCWAAAEKVCDGNRFIYESTYLLGLQQDLANTIREINGSAKMEEIFFRDELFRTYRIFNLAQNIVYRQDNQNAFIQAENVLRVTGGNIKVNITFDWEKTQLGSILSGTGAASVTTDVITFDKTLHTNSSHELQWYLSRADPVNITNGISLNNMEPYRAADYEILSNMLNKLKNNQTTVKDNLYKVINTNYKSILQKYVYEDMTEHFEKVIEYTYYDYRGKFNISYTNTLMNSRLVQEGLYLLFSQVTVGDERFQCGVTVPFEPQDPKAFGGAQQFISNSLIKSTLRYAIDRGSLDVILTEEFWQSRAFQFFMGDMHDVMPSSTKSLSTLQEISGKCKALDDPVFSFAKKTASSYEVKVNFACDLNFNSTHLIGIDMVANYEISPKLASKKLDFVLTSITGAPAFIESPPYKIEYQQLAEFMVGETIAIAKGGTVIGSGYKPSLNRKFPSTYVHPDYLFLFDSSVKLSAKTQ